jgi:hypothetical protein
MYEQTPLQSAKVDNSNAVLRMSLENLNTVKNDIKETVNCINKRVSEFRGVEQIDCKQPEFTSANKGLMGEMEIITNELLDLASRLRSIDSELIKVVG